MIETLSNLPRQSSAIVGYLGKSSVFFGKCRKILETFLGQLLQNLWKSLESFRKSSENRKNIVISMFE